MPFGRGPRAVGPQPTMSKCCLSLTLRKLHGLFSSRLKLTRSHPKDVLFWFFFELWHKLAHLTAWSQPGGGHLRHIPLQPP